MALVTALVQRQHEKTLDEMNAALEKALIGTLSSNERHYGLMKWGISQVMNDTHESQTPAARILLDRMKPSFEEKRLSAELRDVYLDLETKAWDRGAIHDVMHYPVIEVPWESGTTRL